MLAVVDKNSILQIGKSKKQRISRILNKKKKGGGAMGSKVGFKAFWLPLMICRSWDGLVMEKNLNECKNTTFSS